MGFGMGYGMGYGIIWYPYALMHFAGGLGYFETV